MGLGTGSRNWGLLGVQRAGELGVGVLVHGGFVEDTQCPYGAGAYVYTSYVSVQACVMCLHKVEPCIVALLHLLKACLSRGAAYIQPFRLGLSVVFMLINPCPKP